MPIERQRIGSAPFRLSERILEAPTSYSVASAREGDTLRPCPIKNPEEVVATERIMIKPASLVRHRSHDPYRPLVVPAVRVLIRTATGNDVAIDNDDIGGVVTGPKGPEAGVWVIAETRDLPVRYIKSVVTDDRGRFVVPDLPPANYQVWARGYGLVDSAKTTAKPGQRLGITAVIAPSEAAAAHYYPAIYWYSMLHDSRRRQSAARAASPLA